MLDEEYEDPLSLAKGIIRLIPIALVMWAVVIAIGWWVVKNIF